MNQPSNLPNEPVDRYLAGDSEFSRLYRELPQEEPSPQMAEKVRALARQALVERATAKRPAQGWFDRLFHTLRVPLAALASSVLVVTISLNVLQEKGDQIIDPGSDPTWERSTSTPPATQSEAASQPAPHTAPSPASTPALNKPPVAQSRPAPAPPKAQAKAPPQSQSPEHFQEKALPFDLNNLPPLTPEQWLADIQALIKAGKTAEASEELLAFTHAHPNQALPTDLQALLPPSPTEQGNPTPPR